jgi:hypothetical protein
MSQSNPPTPEMYLLPAPARAAQAVAGDLRLRDVGFAQDETGAYVADACRVTLQAAGGRHVRPWGPPPRGPSPATSADRLSPPGSPR